MSWGQHYMTTDRNSHEPSAQLFLEGLPCHVFRQVLGTYLLVKDVTVCHTDVQKMLENSHVPSPGLVVDRVGPQHLIRCIDTPHVLIVLSHCCGSGDRDPLSHTITRLLPAQHCVPSEHRVDVAAKGDFPGVHPLDK